MLLKNKKEKIVTIEKSEKWMIYNKFIKKGYRMNFNTYSKCIKSILKIHNEIGNIWTHLIGFLVYFTILILFILEIVFDFKDNTIKKFNDLKKLPIYLFYISSLFCLFGSTYYHTFTCISKKKDRKLQKLDFLGIFVLILGSCIPIYYAGFYCNFKLFYIYCSTTFISCLFGFLIFFIDKLHEDRFKILKFIIFIIVSILISIPILHILIDYYYYKKKDCLKYYQGYNYVVIHGLIYIFGLIIYTIKIPERFFPNKFDNFFNSHNIWHIIILIACFYNYIGVNELFKNRFKILCINN